MSLEKRGNRFDSRRNFDLHRYSVAVAFAASFAQTSPKTARGSLSSDAVTCSTSTSFEFRRPPAREESHHLLGLFVGQEVVRFQAVEERSFSLLLGGGVQTVDFC
jgi:hypothetical protein